MKASKFILNTDYITTQNDAEGEITIFIPSSIYIAPGEYKIVDKRSITLGKTASVGYRAYIKSTAFNDAITCVNGEAYLMYGNTQMALSLSRDSKSNFSFAASFPASPSARTLTGTGQNITVHIQTFVDPFEV